MLQVVIERVVFSPKKKAGENSICETNDVKTKKKKKNRENEEITQQPQKSKGQSKTCVLM